MNPILKSGVLVVAAVAVAVILIGKRSDSPGTDTSAHITRTDLPRIVCLGAGKCIPCKAMEPVREALRTEYPDQLGVTFHDVWKNPQIGKDYNVYAIPTTIFYAADGTELDRVEGFISKEDILARFAQHGVVLEK